MLIKINTDGCEDVWVELTLYQNKSLIVSSVYRHPNYNIKPFEDAFVNVIKKFSVNQNYIAMGDFDINYDNSTMSQNIIDYANHISSIGCAQLVYKPTRIDKTSSTIIDHIYANGTFDNQVSPFILCADISDHLPVCIEVKYKPTKKKIKRPFLQQFSEKRMEMFLIDLCRKIITLEMLNDCDVNILLTILSDLTNQFFPRKRLSRKQYKVAKNPWITPEILAAIKNKDKLYAKYLKERTPIFL